MTQPPTLDDVMAAIRGALADSPRERNPDELAADTEAVLAALATLAWPEDGLGAI